MMLIVYGLACHARSIGNPETKTTANSSFGFLFFGSKIKFWMQMLFVVFLLIATQSLIAARLDLGTQTILWILQATLFVWIVRREQMERVVLWTFIVSMCFQSAVIWIQFFMQHIPSCKWLGLAEQLSSAGGVSVIETSFGRFLRGYGVFSHPNIAGGYLLTAIMVLFTLEHSAPSHISRLASGRQRGSTMRYALRLALSALLISALVLTFSRGAMVGLVVFLVSQCMSAWVSSALMPDQNNHNEQKKTAIVSLLNSRSTSVVTAVGMFMLVVFIVFPFRELFFSRVDTSNRLESKSIVERQEYWNQAKEVIKGNLWFGVGLGNYTVELQKRFPNQPSYEYQPPHAVPALALSEIGVVGCVALSFFLLMLVRIWYRGSGIRPLNCPTANYQLPITIIFSLLPILLFDHYLWSFYAGWLLLSIIALGLFGIQINEVREKRL